MSFLTQVIPLTFYKPTTYHENDDLTGQGKIEQSPIPFFFSPSLLIYKPKVESVSLICMYKR
jgi:hypothetical protein